MNRLLFLLFLAFLVFFSQAGCSTQHGNASEASPLVKRGALLIDVRSEQEYESGHIESALHIPYTEISKQITLIEADKNREIVLYCEVGGRSEIAMRKLTEMGYTRVYNAGGYRDLKAELEKE